MATDWDPWSREDQWRFGKRSMQHRGSEQADERPVCLW